MEDKKLSKGTVIKIIKPFGSSSVKEGSVWTVENTGNYGEETYDGYPAGRIDMKNETGVKKAFYVAAHSFSVISQAPPRSNDEILEEARKKYPKGTKYKYLNSDGDVIGDIDTVKDSLRIYRGSPLKIDFFGSSGFVYVDGKWADIVTKNIPAGTWVRITKDFGGHVRKDNFCLLTKDYTDGRTMTGDWYRPNGEILAKNLSLDILQEYFVIWDQPKFHTDAIVAFNRKLLEEAAQKFPIGTKYSPVGSTKSVVTAVSEPKTYLRDSDGKIKALHVGDGLGLIYSEGTWAISYKEEKKEEEQCPFAVGDFVTANRDAPYTYTTNGWEGKVTRVYDTVTMDVRGLNDNSVYTVCAKYFSKTYADNDASLLNEAAAKFPVGTKVRALSGKGSRVGDIEEVTSHPKYYDRRIGWKGSAGFLYVEGRWAEVITETPSQVASTDDDAILKEMIGRYPVGTTYAPMNAQGTPLSDNYTVKASEFEACVNIYGGFISRSRAAGFVYCKAKKKWADIVQKKENVHVPEGNFVRIIKPISVKGLDPTGGPDTGGYGRLLRDYNSNEGTAMHADWYDKDGKILFSYVISVSPGSFTVCLPPSSLLRKSEQNEDEILLKEAAVRYPKGTSYIPLAADGSKFPGPFTIANNLHYSWDNSKIFMWASIHADSGFIYHRPSNTWAEIVEDNTDIFSAAKIRPVGNITASLYQEED